MAATGFDSASLLWVLLAALALDAWLGDPDWLWRRCPHPIVLYGRLINWLDQTVNKPKTTPARKKASGAVVIAASLVGVVALGWGLQKFLSGLGVYGGIFMVILAATHIAQKSLYDHVHAVAVALREGGIENGRAAVAKIAGRDPQSLDQSGVIRASIESLAENFSDAVVAPVFWFLVLGLPGLMAYKLLNTADSMIGHKNVRYRDFGFAAARLDDFANFIPARLSAALIWYAGRSGGKIARIREDAALHTSTNAGWPEAAMAVQLDIALAGPRRYDGRQTEGHWINEPGRKDLTPDNINAALRLYLFAAGLLWVIILIFVLIIK